MDYKNSLWNTYTHDNENAKAPSLFISHIVDILGARRVLEAGCNVGNNLKDIHKEIEVHGIDLNQYALEKAREQLPYFSFTIGSLTNIPHRDSSFDLVMTRGVLIHIHESNMKKATDELFRVSRKWILNLEYYNGDESEINWRRGRGLLWYRNMKKRWMDYDVIVISDTQIPLDIDPNNVRLTLVYKTQNKEK